MNHAEHGPPTDEFRQMLIKIIEMRIDLERLEIKVGNSFLEYHGDDALRVYDRMNFESLCKHTLGISSEYMHYVHELMQMARKSQKCLKR